MHTQNQRAWARSAVATGTCAVLVFPLTASAQTLDRHDPAHDVALINSDGTFTNAPANKTADITLATFRHTHTIVLTKIRLRHYAGGGWRWMEPIKAPTRSYLLEGYKEPGESPEWFFSSDTAIRCPGLSATITPTRDTMQVSVPTKCLDQPKWVRFSLLYMKFSPKAGPYLDDALRKGPATDFDGAWTRRIYAG